MNNKDFETIVGQQLDRCRDLLILKGKEYSTEEDKLHNFKIAAEMQGITQKQALGGMMAKHTVSIYDMIQSVNDFPIIKWDEKITDHINYLLLLRGILIEERDAKQKPVIINS